MNNAGPGAGSRGGGERMGRNQGCVVRATWGTEQGYTVELEKGKKGRRPQYQGNNHKGLAAMRRHTMLTNPSIPYDLCVSVPIPRLLTMG